MSNHLKPCPFCGGDASFNDHTDGCYFTVLRKLKADPPADLSRVPDLIEAWNTRTAIQQAEAHQPATSEPVVSRNPFASRCYTMSESHLSGHRLIVGFEKLGDAQDAHEWVSRQGRGDFTHPAPGVPDGVVRDAERYRWLRSLEHCNEAWCLIGSGNANSNLDAAIDAAMLAASS